MAQEVSLGNGEAPADEARPPQWLIDLKAKAATLRERRERPAGLAFGRWLGDFLDQDTESGLLPAEEKLLFAAAQGEACVLQSRAARLWTAFEAWRKRVHKTTLPAEEGFAEAMTRFLEGAPEAVQEVIHEATIRAVVELGLPADWEPKNAEEAEKLAQAQQDYFAQLELEANPAAQIAAAKNDNGFYQLAVEVAAQALSSASGAPRSDALDLSEETQAKIDEQPRVLRDFFAELVWHVQRAPDVDQGFLPKLKADPEALRPHFDAAFQRYEREAWRWVDPDDTEVRIRASFLRFLCLGGDGAAPVHERRLELHGAFVGEDLNLSGCSIPQPIMFSGCYFAERVLLRDTNTKSLDFPCSRVNSIVGEGVRVHGRIYLQSGFRCDAGVSFSHAAIEGPLSFEGSTFSGDDFAIECEKSQIAADASLTNGFLGNGCVSFAGASIGGDLDCSGGIFRNRTEDGSAIALDCSNIDVMANAVFSERFRSEGLVSFIGAKIGGRLDCRGGIFVNCTADGMGSALNFQYARIEGNARLSGGFISEGKVNFHAARIKGNFGCAGGSFRNPVLKKVDGSPTWIPHAADALVLVGAAIEGVLWLGPHAADAHAKADIAGSVDLSGCHAHTIIDHPSSWPAKRVPVDGGKTLPAFILLDSFTYDSMGGRGDYGTAARKRWLDRQPPWHLGLEFRPQPFEQLIKVYREMGHDGDAREIAKFKQQRRRRANFIKLWHGWGDRPRLFAPLNWLAWPFAIARRAVARSLISALYALEWLIVGFGTAYGYGYLRLSAFLIALWLAGGFIYASASNQGAFAPSNPVIYLNAELREKCAKNWTDCKGAPPELPGFSPLTYSLDVMLPVLDLGQKHDWQPISRTDPPAKVVLPFLAGLPGRDSSDTPEIVLGEGVLDNIVRGQTLLSWAALGLLALMLSGLIKKD